ncbi:hypothetical protein RISK_002717 [Rhodopirellula islandica]|uniref:Uncharacterized protein n=1 Tax=Rhodopirellula islandica TaxID=595434 RepID=A0A0J1BFE2_RHOIS|nr:hypothetical protein RISK_002717 [Rhodopirellula islandica]
MCGDARPQGQLGAFRKWIKNCKEESRLIPFPGIEWSVTVVVRTWRATFALHG